MPAMPTVYMSASVVAPLVKNIVPPPARKPTARQIVFRPRKMLGAVSLRKPA